MALYPDHIILINHEVLVQSFDTKLVFCLEGFQSMMQSLKHVNELKARIFTLETKYLRAGQGQSRSLGGASCTCEKWHALTGFVLDDKVVFQ